MFNITLLPTTRSSSADYSSCKTCSTSLDCRTRGRYSDALPAIFRISRARSNNCIQQCYCLDSVFNTLDSDGFDTIILDAHLKDISDIEVAIKIKQMLPDQRIIITSTISVHADEIEPVGLSNDDDVLQKPSYFSKLLGLIKPEK